MEPVHLHILGCGSAVPTGRHYLSAQVLDLRGKLFLIDCGEGTQLQIRAAKLSFNKISDVFISHLHGDHCFGLIGLISTMGMLGRTAPLRIHAQPDLENVMSSQLAYFCTDLGFRVEFRSFDPSVHALIYEDRHWQVFSLPLIHRVPSTGFLFRERPRAPHVIKEMLDAYQVPLSVIPAIKEGRDFVTAEGKYVPNERLVRPGEPPRSYAYCSDTAFNPALVDYLKGVDLLYHEATFGEDNREMAEWTQHSTARDAATMALRCGAKSLVLGHYSSRYPDETLLLDEAKEIFPQTRLGKEGMVIPLP